MSNDNTTTTAEQSQAAARTEVLGSLEGPCCQPEIEPCLNCLPTDLYPDDVPFVATPEDEAFYREWCREREDRLREERIAADARRAEADLRLVAGVLAALEVPTFPEQIAAFANAFRDHESPDVAWIGEKLGGLHDQNHWLLEAASGEQFDERLAAHLDAEAVRIEARWAALAGR